MNRYDLIEALTSTRFARGSDDWKRAVREADNKGVNGVVDFVAEWLAIPNDCNTAEDWANLWREQMAAPVHLR